MANLIECGTCGYPLTPEERTSLIEFNGKMVKPWIGLTDEEITEIRLSQERDNIRTSEMLRKIEAKLKEKNT